MTWALRVLLAASIIANLVLLLRRDDAAPVSGSPHPEHRREAPMPSFPAGDEAAPPRDYAQLERAAVEQRLVADEARIADLTPIVEKFAAAPRSAETEAHVKPFLDAVFERCPVAEPKYRFECRGRVCKIDSDVTDEWTMPLQNTFPGRAEFREMAFGREGTFIELAAQDEIPALFLTGMVKAALISARKPCAFAEAPAGDVAASIQYDAATRHVTRDIQGSLAGQPIAACIGKALDDVIATTALPPDLTRSTRSYGVPLTLPVADDE